uniref:Buzidau [Apis mellifera] n=1 Tax=Lepeophtheirus salmonis TaxID=72036 RepID=A0A0K2V7U3_LEPSM
MPLNKITKEYHPLGPPPTQPRTENFYPKLIDEKKYSKIPIVNSNDSSVASSELIIKNEQLLKEYNTFKDTVTAGDILFVAEPFVFVPSTATRGLRCEHCFKEKTYTHRLFSCPCCNYSIYCSESCAEKDKEFHGDECALFVESKRPPSSDTVRFTLRLLLKMRRNGGREADIVLDGDKKIYRRFYDLIDHFDDILHSSNRSQLVEHVYAEILKLMGSESAPDPNYFLEVYGRMVINSFHICDKTTQDNIGYALYLGPSIMNHSCVPTASVSFEDKNIVVRSLIDMPKKDVSKVYISYINLMESKEHRQRHLLRNYYFFCECFRCNSATWETSMFSLKCVHCYEKNKELIKEGFVPIGSKPKPENYKSPRCETCGNESIGSERTITDYLEALEIVEDYLAQENIPMDVAKFCLKLMDMNDFHPLHICYVKTTESIFQNWWEDWKEGKGKGGSSTNLAQLATNVVHFGRKLIQYYEKYSLHPWSYEGIILAKTAAVENHLKFEKESTKHLNKANDILSITMGDVVSL